MSSLNIQTISMKLISHISELYKGLSYSKILLIIIATTISILIAGFLYFISVVNSQQTNRELSKSDAITVLTGGSNRLQSAISLLEKGFAKKLFISGVNPKTTSNDLQILNPLYSSLFSCCIELGHSATNTKENAIEIAEWVYKNNFKSLIIVTSNYHMPRALLEIKKFTPNIIISEYAIQSDKVDTTTWWSDWNTLKILIDEYLKILLILLFR